MGIIQIELRKTGKLPRYKTGPWVRGLREKLGIQRIQVVTFLRSSVSQISNVEAGIVPLSFKYVEGLSTILKVPVTTIVEHVLQDALEAADLKYKVTVTPYE